MIGQETFLEIEKVNKCHLWKEKRNLIFPVCFGRSQTGTLQNPSILQQMEFSIKSHLSVHPFCDLHNLKETHPCLEKEVKGKNKSNVIKIG